MREFAHPDVEVVLPSEYVDVGTVHGHGGLERWLTTASQVYDTFWYELEGVLDAGDGRVLTLLHVRVRGRASGAAVEFDAAHLLDLEDGRVTRLVVYRDRAEGLQATGLAWAVGRTANRALDPWRDIARPSSASGQLFATAMRPAIPPA